jgi:26S proteasome regulatory subunit T4
MADQEKDAALGELRKRLLQHKEIEAKVKTLRDQVKESKTHYDKTEDDLKALQSVGQIIGEVLRQLDEERCKELPSRRHTSIPGTL